MIDMAQNDIAIVIPAYRAADIHKTLQSLAYQTDRNFTVYIGDDCSADDIKGIADDFDPKKVKRPKSAKGAELVFYVNSTMVRYFLADETDFYQDLAESLTAAESEKQRKNRRCTQVWQGGKALTAFPSPFGSRTAKTV